MGKVKHCVYGCCSMKTNPKTNAVNNWPGVFFIKFPSPVTQHEKCKRWINACGRNDFNVSDVKRSTYICSRHFVDSCGPSMDNPDPIAFIDLYPKLEDREMVISQLSGLKNSNELVIEKKTETVTSVEMHAEIFDVNFNDVTPWPGWSLEIHLSENCAVFSKTKNNFAIMQCVFSQQSGKEITVAVLIKNELTALPIPGESIVLRSLNDIYEHLKKVDKFTFCPGNSDLELVRLFKNKPVSSRQTSGIYCDKLNSVISKNCQHYVTSRQKRCSACTKYRSTLRKLRIRKMLKLRKIQSLKLLKKSKERSILSENAKREISSLMILFQEKLKEEPPESLARVFLTQQIKAMKRNKFGMRWDPQFIKWCICLKNKSTKAYETIRRSGLVTMPTQRTLYSHNRTRKHKPGFSFDSIKELVLETIGGNNSN